MDVAIPDSLKREHQDLHEELDRATKVPGRVGEAARAVAALLHPHLQREEEFALPPLGLLPALAQGRPTPEMREVIALTEKLRAELPRMLSEHKAVFDALEMLNEAARTDGRPHIAAFSERLIAHARTEEEVLYPASLLIGEYLKAALAQ